MKAVLAPELPCLIHHPIATLWGKGMKRFGPGKDNVQLLSLILQIISTIFVSETTVLRYLGKCLCFSGSHGEHIMYIIHSVTCIQGDLHTLQRFFREEDTQIYSNLCMMYRLRPPAPLEVCTSRLSGTKGI